MPSYIVKTTREDELFVLWSDITDSPHAWGTQEQLRDIRWLSATDLASDRFERARRTGSSALWPSSDQPYYGWDDSGMVYQQEGYLPRANLAEFCKRLQSDMDVSDLLQPFDDD